MHGPHPTTRHRSPGHHCPLRPCRCDTAHSQCEHLATRASGACGQGVGNPSRPSKSSFLKAGEMKRGFLKAGKQETVIQLDGNISLNSESESEEEPAKAEDQILSKDEEVAKNEDESNEEGESESDEFSAQRECEQSANANLDKSKDTPVWYEPHCKRPSHIPPARTTIRRDDRIISAAALPSFSAPNCRSLGPKIKNFQDDMFMQDIDVALCSETWEKSNNKKYQKNIEEMLELNGLKMISNPRKYKRGGGVCIIANLTKVDIKALEVANPENVEAVFALVKPKITSEIKEIITFAFYSPPRSKKKAKLIDHLVTTIHTLLSRFPRAGVMGGGDRNCLNISPILAAIPRMQNIQQLPTLGGKILMFCSPPWHPSMPPLSLPPLCPATTQIKGSPATTACPSPIQSPGTPSGNSRSTLSAPLGRCLTLQNNVL